MYHHTEEHTLWKRRNILFFLPIDIKVPDQSIGKAHAVYEIPFDGKLVATNNEVSFSIDRTDLNECWKIGTSYYCLSLITRKHDMTDSCRVAL